MHPRTIVLRMSLRTSPQTDVAIRSPKPSPPGKVARASPASARRMRALPLPMGEVPLEGAERAHFTLSVGFAASSPRVGAKGGRIVTGGATPVTSPTQIHHKNCARKAKSLPGAHRKSNYIRGSMPRTG